MNELTWDTSSKYDILDEIRANVTDYSIDCIRGCDPLLHGLIRDNARDMHLIIEDNEVAKEALRILIQAGRPVREIRLPLHMRALDAAVDAIRWFQNRVAGGR